MREGSKWEDCIIYYRKRGEWRTRRAERCVEGLELREGWKQGEEAGGW